jgi:hypothetical protein
MLLGGAGVALGPGTVVVTPDPGLMEADPRAMTLAHADMLSADASRAVAMMNQANNEARTAWQVSASAFDAVTAQSPSMQLAALKIRVKNMGASLDSAGIEAIMLMTSGMAYGSVPGGGDEDDDDDLSPEMLSELERGTPMLAADIEDEEKMTVDGVAMDGAIAADIEGNGTAAWTDAEIAALSPATGDPVTGGLISRQEPGDPARRDRSRARCFYLTGPRSAGPRRQVSPPRPSS